MAPLPPRASPTVETILAAYEADAGDGWREHLGASVIGRECERALWYAFRWMTRTAQRGRMLRLFETGRLEEERLVRDLRRIGVTVLDVDPDTGRQWHVKAHGGHFGGSLDGVGLGIPEAPGTWHVLEFKTHNAKSFAELKQHGVREAKPEHWAQTQVYMHLTGLTRALYLAACKDTDALYAERVRVDHEEAERLIARAGQIIFAARPPAGSAMTPTGSSAGAVRTSTPAMVTSCPSEPAGAACISPRPRTASGTALALTVFCQPTSSGPAAARTSSSRT